MTIQITRHSEALEVVTHVHNAIAAHDRKAVRWWEIEKLQTALDAAENLAANLRHDLDRLKENTL